MREQFLNYNLSNKLFSLSFDEPVFAHYMNDEAWKLDLVVGQLYLKDNFIKDASEYIIPAPLYQQVFDWFRERHNLMIVQDLTSYGKYFFNIKNVKTFEEIYYDSTECYDTFNQMMEKAVEKLIEILENRNE